MKKEDELGRMQLENVHLTDKIIETDDGPAHVKGECLSPMKENKDLYRKNLSSDKIKSEPGKPAKAGQTGLSGSHPIGPAGILQFILNDPVYQRLIKERPEVEKDFIGPMNVSAKTFTCSECGAQFPRFWLLSRHHKQAHGEVVDRSKEVLPTDSKVNLMCGECGFEAGTPNQLRRHKNTAQDHETMSRLKFPYVPCGTLLFSRQALDKHIKNIHNAPRNHKCSKCSSAFTSKLGLNKHKQRMHLKPFTDDPGQGRDGKFKCNKCNATFDTLILLSNHKERHVTKYKYVRKRCKCKICGDDFAGRNPLIKHIRLVHTKTLLQCVRIDTATGQKKNAFVKNHGGTSPLSASRSVPVEEATGSAGNNIIRDHSEATSDQEVGNTVESEASILAF